MARCTRTAETTFSGPLEFDPEVNNFWPSNEGLKQIQDGDWLMVWPASGLPPSCGRRRAEPDIRLGRAGHRRRHDPEFGPEEHGMTTAQAALSGILVGGLCALMAIGLSLTWGMLKIINLAHFGLILIGAYLTYQTATSWGSTRC